MTKRQKANQILAIVTAVLFFGGIVFAFTLNQLWFGIVMMVAGMIIFLVRVTWSIAGWADNTLQRWADKNLAPKDGIDVTFTIEEKDDEK